MASRENRRERNQELFRLGNERLHEVVENQVPEESLVPFLCECADDDCFEQVSVTLEEWEAVASDPNNFLMLAGHQRNDGEYVVASLLHYEIARKPE
ncbi:hypothetical protein BH18ACT14_BH18ACT14_01350 [soil metagenome]